MFISAFDERARPKGSRDPLGIEAIWSFMGRKVVGNLTTITSNLDSFIVALLCCKHAHESATQLKDIQEHFMRAEQLAAYLKLAEDKGGFFGITQAKKNFGTGKVSLGAGTEHQLLSAQLSYGLWGLYSTALEGAGLITSAQRRLTDNGLKLSELIIAQMDTAAWHQFKTLATRSNPIPTSELTSLAPKFIAMLDNADLKRMVVDALLATQRDCILQSELYIQAQEYLKPATAPIEVAPFCAWLLASPAVSAELKLAMTHISEIEPILVVAEIVMNWLQGESNTPLTELHASLALRLKDISHNDSWRQAARLPHRPFLEKLYNAINQSDAPEVISVILAQNKSLMQQRGGAAWIELDVNKVLTVRVRNDRSQLPDDLFARSQVWNNTYFLSAFLHITKQALS